MTLSVSRKGLACASLARFLQSRGISALVRPNISSTTNGLENGCQVVAAVDHGKDVKRTWGLLRDEFGFNCGHLRIEGRFSGCVLDFVRPSSCPGELKSSSTDDAV